MRQPALAVISVVACLTACGSASTASRATPSRGSVVTVPATATPTPLPPLSEPAIVQVENSPEGRPQSGLQAADVVYEYVAEGGIGRFSLFFFGAPPDGQKVGPVRSARTVTVQLATIYHAVLAYSGASTYIQGLIDKAPFPSFNENTAQGNLFRISSRFPPHNLYTSGTDIAHLATLGNLKVASYQLWPRATSFPAGASVASFTVFVSNFEQPVFTWNAGLHGFTRTESTGPVADPDTGRPLSVPTVIVQQVAVTTDPKVVDVNGVFGVDQRITGSGNAQVFTDGQEYDAQWVQPATGPPQFTLAGGAPAPIASGEVWISLVPIGQPALVVPGPPIRTPNPRYRY